MFDDIGKLGAKIIGPTIRHVAQAGGKRLLVVANESSWKLMEEPLKGLKASIMQCQLADLIKRIYWQVPAVTILDFATLVDSASDGPNHLRLFQVLGTKVIVVNCPSETKAREMIHYGASDCLPSLEIHGAIDALKFSAETLIAQVRSGIQGSWWKRILN